MVPSNLEIEILDLESEQWETIQFKDLNFGLWYCARPGRRSVA